MNTRFIIIFALLLFTKLLNAQDHDHADHDHDHDDHHHHAKNEIGVANSAVYFVSENEIGYGLHFHYLRTIKESKFGMGLAYERIFDEHKHNMIGVVGSYNPVDRLILLLSPGVAFEDGEADHSHFAIHFETTYHFEIKNFHIGPVLGFAYDFEDFHIGLGLHIGLGF